MLQGKCVVEVPKCLLCAAPNGCGESADGGPNVRRSTVAQLLNCATQVGQATQEPQAVGWTTLQCKRGGSDSCWCGGSLAPRSTTDTNIQTNYLLAFSRDVSRVECKILGVEVSVVWAGIRSVPRQTCNYQFAVLAERACRTRFIPPSVARQARDDTAAGTLVRLLELVHARDRAIFLPQAKFAIAVFGRRLAALEASGCAVAAVGVLVLRLPASCTRRDTSSEFVVVDDKVAAVRALLRVQELGPPSARCAKRSTLLARARHVVSSQIKCEPLPNYACGLPCNLMKNNMRKTRFERKVAKILEAQNIVQSPSPS